MLAPSQLAVIINANPKDKDSIAIGEYYVAKRTIPAANVFRIAMPISGSFKTADFLVFKAAVDAALKNRPDIKAIGLCTRYCRVMLGATSAQGFNSLTSAVSMGLTATGKSTGCYDSPATGPYRLAMLITGKAVDDAKAMIDRGVASDGARPSGKAYIMAQPGNIRDVRGTNYASSGRPTGFGLSPLLDIELVNAKALSNTTDALFYFQGQDKCQDWLDWVKKNPDGTYTPVTYGNVMPPGAWVDNLDSAYGEIDNGMNILNALMANMGTASYGTVTEPYAIASKFADPWVLMTHYTAGDTIIEAAWKSVALPYLGIFVGDPLAAPYA